RWSCGSWLLLCQAAFGGTAPPLPTVTTFGDTVSAIEATLYLDLRVNGAPVGVVPVQQTGEELSVRVSDLSSAGVNISMLADANAPWLSLGRAPGVRYRYDVNALLLELTVPPEWLAVQRLDETLNSAQHANSSAGLALNYGVHVIDGEAQPVLASLWSQQRMFGALGVFTNTGLRRYSADGESSPRAGNRQRGYVRFDTAWFSSNEQQLYSWTIGDLVTSAQTWSAPARIAGVRLARDFRLRPDLITYPLPQFAGQAATPSTLDLFINGQLA